MGCVELVSCCHKTNIFVRILVLLFLLSGECLGGALWWKDLLQLAEEVGFSPPRLVTAKLITIQNKELEKVLGMARHNVVVMLSILLFSAYVCVCFKNMTQRGAVFIIMNPNALKQCFRLNLDVFG